MLSLGILTFLIAGCTATAIGHREVTQDETERLALLPEMLDVPPPPQPPPPPMPPSKPKPAPSDATCGWSATSQGRVIGGVDAKAGAWPWQIALYEWDEFKCGGTLIHPQWVITAQHCMASYYNEEAYYVVLGDHDRTLEEGSEVTVKVAKIIKHPGYHQGGYYNNDIALLKLETPAMFNSRVFPACLPSPEQAATIGTKCYITGWGKIRHPGTDHPMLQQAPLPVVSRSECKTRLLNSLGGNLMNVTERMVCAGEGHASSILSGCQGDSGGPFVCQGPSGKWYLQGVVSWGSPRCNVQDRYTVFAKVAEFKAWIQQQIKWN